VQNFFSMNWFYHFLREERQLQFQGSFIGIACMASGFELLLNTVAGISGDGVNVRVG
jgi:hypothetical protein